MITAILTDCDDEARLGASLAGLTTAAIDGLVRQVIVCEAGASPAALEVAEDSGATVIAGGLAEAAAAARQSWLLILPAGARLQMQWEPAAQRHIRLYPDRAGWFSLNHAADGPAARFGEVWANGLARWLGLRRPQHGLLIPARQWRETGGAGRGHRRIEARILLGGVSAG